MRKRIGTCSICGGDVVGVSGSWYSVNPPPAAYCKKCGAVESIDIIQMTKRPGRTE